MSELRDAAAQRVEMRGRADVFTRGQPHVQGVDRREGWQYCVRHVTGTLVRF